MNNDFDKNNQIVQDLLGAINSQRLYSDKHLQTILLIERLMSNLSRVFESEDKLFIGIFNDNILINQKPLVGIGKVSQSLIKALNRVDIDEIVFLKGLDQEEFTSFLTETFGQEDLESSDYPHLLLGKISSVEKDNKKDKVDSALDLDSAQDFIWTLKNLDVDKPLNFEVVKNLALDLIENFKFTENPLQYLIQINSEDDYTYLHIINVAILSASLGKHIGISGGELLDIIYSALLHDLGMILAPKEILSKSGTLTPKEFEIIKSHPLKGAMYLSKQKYMPKLPILVALEHHVKFMGGGYPPIFPDWKPHIASQIISIADIYDALRSNRPYRPPLDQEQIIRILRDGQVTGLKPNLVEVFIKMISEEKS